MRRPQKFGVIFHLIWHLLTKKSWTLKTPKQLFFSKLKHRFLLMIIRHWDHYQKTLPLIIRWIGSTKSYKSWNLNLKHIWGTKIKSIMTVLETLYSEYTECKGSLPLVLTISRSMVCKNKITGHNYIVLYKNKAD